MALQSNRPPRRVTYPGGLEEATAVRSGAAPGERLGTRGGKAVEWWGQSSG